jgi:mRNA interferase RelE/StbE
MRVKISRRAKKELKALSKINQIAIWRKIVQLSQDKGVGNIEKMSGYTDIFRLRIGNYRIVYRKEPQKYHVVTIAHRKEIYQKVKRLLG